MIDIIKIKNQLLIEEPFFGYIMLRLKFIEDNKIPTMQVDGISLKYNINFATQMGAYDSKVIIVHELLHCILRHITRGIGHIPQISGYAADYAVNAFIVHNTPYTLPACGLYDRKYVEWSYEAIYADLLKQCGGKPDEELSEESERMGEFVPAPPDQIPEGTNGLTMEEFWTNTVTEAIQMQKAVGKGSTNIEELIQLFKPSQLPWKVLLKRFLTRFNRTGANWNIRNRRSSSIGKFLPGKQQGKKLKKIVIALDTSGSMSEKELAHALGETSAILSRMNYNRIYYIQCDWEVTSVEEFRKGQKVSGFVKGRGGTQFKPVFDKVEALKINPDCLIYFTDMDGSFEFKKPSYPVLWIDTYHGGRHPAPFGETIILKT